MREQHPACRRPPRRRAPRGSRRARPGRARPAAGRGPSGAAAGCAGRPRSPVRSPGARAPRRAPASGRPSGAPASAASRRSSGRRPPAPRAGSRTTPRIRVEPIPNALGRAASVEIAGSTDEDRVERRVEIDRQAPAAAQVVDAIAGLLAQPAGQGVVARQVRHGGEVRRVPDGDDVGRVEAVGERPPLAAPGGLQQVRDVPPPRQRDRARAEHDEPGARRQAGGELAQPLPERSAVRRALVDPRRRRRRPSRSASRGARRSARRAAASAVASSPEPDAAVGCRIRTVTGCTRRL